MQSPILTILYWVNIVSIDCDYLIAKVIISKADWDSFKTFCDFKNIHWCEVRL